MDFTMHGGETSGNPVYLWQVSLLESNHQTYVGGVWGGNSRCILYKTVFRAKGWQEMAHHDGTNRNAG